MRFIYRDKAYLHMAQFGLKEFRTKSFGRDVEQFCAAKDAVFECDEDFLVGETRVDGCSADAPASEVVHLIMRAIRGVITIQVPA